MNTNYDFSDIYKQLINLKNANIQLRKNIDFLKKTVHKKDSIIKKLYTDVTIYEWLIKTIKWIGYTNSQRIK